MQIAACTQESDGRQLTEEDDELGKLCFVTLYSVVPLLPKFQQAAYLCSYTSVQFSYLCKFPILDGQTTAEAMTGF